MSQNNQSPNQDALRCHAVRWKNERDRAWIDELVAEHWCGEPTIVRGVEHRLSELPTLIAGEHDGIAAFTPGGAGATPELLLLHALTPSTGVGTALLHAVVADVRSRGCERLLVTTTNDNVAALRFYQRYGFRFFTLRVGAVDEARVRKPTIPIVGFNGIAIHDEIDLILHL